MNGLAMNSLKFLSIIYHGLYYRTCNVSLKQLRLYTKFLWINWCQSTKEVVLISLRSIAIMNSANWWIHFWKNKICQLKLIMQQRKNMFRELNKIITIFKNAFEQHTTDSHLRIKRIFWWNFLLQNQQRSFKKSYKHGALKRALDNAIKNLD